MKTATASETRTTGTSVTAAQTGDPAYQAYRILQAGFIAAPILAGIDKFFNILVNWEQYLAPFVGNLIAPGLFMAVVGVVEIAAGIGVAVKHGFSLTSSQSGWWASFSTCSYFRAIST